MWSLTIDLIEKVKVMQRAMECAIPGVSRRTKFIEAFRTRSEVEVLMGRPCRKTNSRWRIVSRVATMNQKAQYERTVDRWVEGIVTSRRCSTDGGGTRHSSCHSMRES